jgi:hypothetical protein
MGTLDYLKAFRDKAIDAATYDLLSRNFELLESNCQLYKDKCELLEGETSVLKTQIKKLQNENIRLQSEVGRSKAQEEFTIREGIAFKKGPDGKYAEEGYCPTCRVLMNSDSRVYSTCPKCKYKTNLRRDIRQIVAQLNAE